ncbi:MAG: response regulator [Acidobacteriia bacterium]|nr:response regulator [Terriglobia bacterium]MBV8904249.1 response regulator [Terriglobia bacterium]MBV9746886.1 response regulator [Terriglobia bacterium]
MAYRVLIVDDSPAMRAFVRRVMEISGFELAACLEASNGIQALEVLQNEWVDAILSDINMPEMDGEELLQRLEADESLRRIPVVIISTDGTKTRVERMMQLGARGYVMKPFRPEELREELERSLEVVNE